MAEEKNQYSIGKVSTLCNVPVRTLRYYDKIGLLVPSHRKDDNHYRYYSQEQLLTLFIIYYGLPIVLGRALSAFGAGDTIEINPFIAGMVAIGVVFSAYCAEVLQSAFKAIPHGQYEGGYAIGLTHGQTMRLVILPQLIRIALPGLGNLWMTLLKDTALVSAVGLPDILRQANIAAKVTKQAFLFYGLACLLFLVLAILSSFIFSWIENRARRAEVRR